ncbi:hypothetical protein [Aporhodopirellula aestuarii]|uniref:Uncharacterized protein n=1 Tax=Aporhodopirellula aestuarii TaxID=2950107 RepID=A0ABT0U7F9_9BACT|nr:hypothetical protein [Aporhodopirellula aestuarii]MCM2372353.1 hypothetical protein [Aporhodopirellula aestuarii]
MIEDVLLLALRLTFLLAVFGVAAVFHRCHRFVLKQSKLHLLPRIQRYSWALPPIEPSTANRFGLTKTRLKWVAGWYLSGLVIGVVVGLLLSFAGVFLLFWGFDTIDSLISGRRATGKHSGASYDPVGNAAHGITMMLITLIVASPFLISSVTISVSIAHAIVSSPARLNDAGRE